MRHSIDMALGPAGLGIAGMRAAIAALKKAGVAVRFQKRPPSGREWLPVKTVDINGTARCHCAASGRAGEAHVVPAAVVLSPDPLGKNPSDRWVRYTHNWNERQWGLYVLPAVILDDGHFFAPGEVEAFLAGLDHDAARMGAPV